MGSVGCLSNSSQPMVAPAVPDPVVGSGGGSPVLWASSNDDEYPPASIWDYGDPFLDF